MTASTITSTVKAVSTMQSTFVSDGSVSTAPPIAKTRAKTEATTVSLVAVLFQPLHVYLQRFFNRLINGERDDPYVVLSRLGARFEAALIPEAVLPTVVQTVAQALKLPYAAITLKQGEMFVIAASYGISQHELFTLPLPGA